MADPRIEVTCPGCERPFLVPATEQGKIAECPRCQGWVDVPEIGRPPTGAEVEGAAAARTAQEYERQTEENARQLAESARQQAEMGRQIEQWQRQLDQQDRRDVRLDVLIDRLGRTIGQWEQLAERVGRVIDRLGGSGPS